MPTFKAYAGLDGRRLRGGPNYLQTTALEGLGELCVPADSPRVAQEAMVQTQDIDWLSRIPRTEVEDMSCVEKSSVETYIDGAAFPHGRLASKREVGRDGNGDLAVKTTLRRPLQAGKHWLCTDTFRPHAMCAAACHATAGQSSVIRC